MTGQDSSSENTLKPVRPFLSSTFLDFHVERDYLIKKIFPMLNKTCMDRGTYFAPVDLRWGISEEQAKSGHVIRLCFDYIHQSAPFFICLLGERYGQHRDSCLSDLPESQTQEDPPPDASWLDKSFVVAAANGYDWVLQDAYQGCSVTELEVIEAAFRCQHEHCYFYFRIPSSMQTLFKDIPVDERQEKLKIYQSESDNALQKVTNLKQRILTSGYPVKYFSSPEELGEQVQEDWLKVVDGLYPVVAGDKGAADLNREWHHQLMYADTRCHVFIQTQALQLLMQNLTHFVQSISPKEQDNSDDASILVLSGDHGCGKTSIISNWLKILGQNQEHTRLFCHFAGSSTTSTDISTFFKRCMMQLRSPVDGCVEIEPPETANLLSASREFFASVESHGKCIIVIDGLEKLSAAMDCSEQQVKELAWLPQHFPAQCKLIVTCAKSDTVYESLVQRSDTVTAEVPLLSDHESKTAVIQGHLKLHCKALTSTQLYPIVTHHLSAVPLFLCALANELRVFGSHSDLDNYLQTYLRATSVCELWQMIVQRWCREYGWDKKRETCEAGGWVQDALCLLAASRHGLSQTELLSMLTLLGYAHSTEVTAFDWALFWSTTSEAFFESPQGLLCFAHDDLREAVLASVTMTYHEVICSYFCQQPHSQRRTEELPWQLERTSNFTTLYKVLCEPLVLMDLYDLKYNHSKRLELLYYWGLLKPLSLLPCAGYRDMIHSQLHSSSILLEINNDDPCPVQEFLHDSNKVKSGSIEHIKQYIDVKNKPMRKWFECAVLAKLTGQLLAETGYFDVAEQCLMVANKILIQYGTEGHCTETLTKELKCNVEQATADLYYYQLKRDKAQAWYKQALSSVNALLSGSTTHTNTYLHLKGEILDRLGTMKTFNFEYTDAEPLLQEALHCMKMVDNAAGVATVLQHTATLAARQERYSEAIQMFHEVIQVREQWYGKCHPKVVETVNGLAGVLADRRTGPHYNPTEAERLYKRALQIRENCLGRDHLLVATTLFHLGKLVVEYDMSRKSEGLDLVWRALHIREDKLGPHHQISEAIRKFLHKTEGKSDWRLRHPCEISAWWRGDPHTLPPNHRPINAFGNLDRRNRRIDSHWEEFRGRYGRKVGYYYYLPDFYVKQAETIKADRSVIDVMGQPVQPLSQSCHNQHNEIPRHGRAPGQNMSALHNVAWFSYTSCNTRQPSISDLYAEDTKTDNPSNRSLDQDHLEPSTLNFHDVSADGINVFDWSYLDPDFHLEMAC